MNYFTMKHLNQRDQKKLETRLKEMWDIENTDLINIKMLM